VLHGELPEVFDCLDRHGITRELSRSDVPAAEEDRRPLHFDAVFAEEETGTNLTFARDKRVRRWAREIGLRIEEFPHNGVIRGLTDRDARMEIWRERMARETFPVPPVIPMSERTRELCRRRDLPSEEELGFESPAGAVQRVDEQAAHIVLDSFLRTRARLYSKGISSPSLSRHSGSRLSVHLAWGSLSLRTAVKELDAREEQIRRVRAGERRNSDPTPEEVRGRLGPLKSFRSRLYWHDHFCQRLEREPQMEYFALNRRFEDIVYDGTEELEERLWAGRTGYPMVDATVRALSHTGFANFRMRAMIVSFATYALHLDWRRLRDPMARIMADYLPGIHISQLQMQAGVVGINTVRVYNPTKQILDNDPDCAFIKRFIPELREFTPETIIAHAVSGVDSPSHGKIGKSTDAAGFWTGPGGSLGDYPAPVVDFRERVKPMQSEMYRRKGSAEGRAEARRVLEKHGSRRGRA
jgi:deoxyribodipyrimidine photo-lyase